MKAMQTGEIVNRTENRPALHTAMRDLFGSPLAPKASQMAQEEIDKLRKFLPQLDRFTTLVQIGIGGSSLGPEAISIALTPYARKGKRVRFLTNVDPDDGAAIFKSVDLARTVFVVVSKSGTTLETRTNELWARQKLQEAGLVPEEQIVAVTAKGSPMDDPSRYLGAFYIWDFIGGRYSATSMVGVVQLAFLLGIEPVIEFLRGAHEMDRLALETDAVKNLPLLASLLGIWNRNFLAIPTVAVIPYSQLLARFPAHLQQLDMESNGKPAASPTGPVIWGEPGTNAQHSFFQLLHQGSPLAAVEFIAFLENTYGDDVVEEGTSSRQKLLANLFAQALALARGAPGNRGSTILLGNKLTPQTVGSLLAYYEHKVAFQGFLWGINSFDQPGVELGKKLASSILKGEEPLTLYNLS
jgi:glucose-6-phosphate isomerase